MSIATPLNVDPSLASMEQTSPPRLSRFTEHFEARLPTMRQTDVPLSENLRLELIDAEETCDAMAKAISPITLELDEILGVSKALTQYLLNIDHFYTSRGLPPRGLPSRESPTKSLDPLDMQAAELRGRVENLQEHKLLLERRLRVWEKRVEKLRPSLLAACHMAPYAQLPPSPPSTPPPRSKSRRPRHTKSRRSHHTKTPPPPSRAPPPPPQSSQDVVSVLEYTLP